MRERHIEQVDLNLLPPLIALLEERHVSRAAARSKLSQPAMSRALGRLRQVLGDELLVRGRDGYQLTPRAERIQAGLATVVPQLDALLSEERFDPRTSPREFRLIGSDYAVSTFGAQLFQEVFTQSPESTVRFESWRDGVFDDVERGVVDLVFFGVAGPDRLRSEPLFEERFVCVVSQDHPLAGRGALDLDDYLRCTHLVVAVDQGRQPAVDHPLGALGRRRHAGLTTPYHACAATAVVGTRLVATLPLRIVEASSTPDVVVLGAPREVETMTYTMSWHPRLDQDPGHRWLRSVVRAASADPSDPCG